jgi:hypothetical protein
LDQLFSWFPFCKCISFSQSLQTSKTSDDTLENYIRTPQVVFLDERKKTK